MIFFIVINIILLFFLNTLQRMYLVMELCSQGELNSLYKEKEALPEEEAKAVIKRLAKAVSYLHKNGIFPVHVFAICCIVHYYNILNGTDHTDSYIFSIYINALY